MAEKHGYSFDGHPGKEKLNRDCIAETVSVAVWNERDLKESLKPPSPIRNGALLRSMGIASKRRFDPLGTQLRVPHSRRHVAAQP